MKPTLEQVPAIVSNILESQQKIEKLLSDFGSKFQSVSSVPQKELLTNKEACALLDINRTTLWKWEKEGIIQAHGLEGRRYFKYSEIMEALIPLNNKN
ncbi:helix-turn-helix domain-containing protein [Epilithonimonas ginsengisoli]|uniref:Helix-turn-helix domain-containing protein n=1 Tax=Epilithonimonas ginsengisoli TaxID=1245592 RepID=A0ABU4JIU8_9FLAO|nr:MULTISPECIES: helix-turn-helix domain-containing protein [Chryseobacterium group]MBV6879108.1 helix-turn-helix domain-containing protein [Epilithonimonas sp. FP105]MDW8549542.1 helix-turn-helix domain-containing protein [Epilithonimonas ginsengisoli]OAH74404.1 hypothetical protein AXA65_06500 [Chryseobacterium sp. FP211-J200]